MFSMSKLFRKVFYSQRIFFAMHIVHSVQPAKIPSGSENKWISEVLQRQQKALES